jgi:hypothetical protein
MSFLFGGGSSASTPPPPQLPDPLPSTPTYASGTGKPSGNTNRIPGFGDTLLTSSLGVDQSKTNTAKKSLLGQ